MGEVTVQVVYQDQEAKPLSLIVVQGSGPALLGRNWLQHFVLDCCRIKTVLRDGGVLQQLLQEFSGIFADELGTITPVKAKLVVSSSATPRFHRPRPVPYALRPLVEQELDRLERAGVLERVDHSDWAAPIVTVPKRDGQVRICDDYKVTINPVLDVDQYPLPRPEDLFATLAGGRYFQHSTSHTPTTRSYLMTMLDNFLQSTLIVGCTDLLAYLSVWRLHPRFFRKQWIKSCKA